MEFAILLICIATLIAACYCCYVSSKKEEKQDNTDDIVEAVEQRISLMEQTITKVENDQQEMTRRHNASLNDNAIKQTGAYFELMDKSIRGTLQADKTANKEILDGNSKVLTTGLETLNKTTEIRLTKLTETIDTNFAKLRIENNAQIDKIRETVSEKLDKTLNEQFEKSFKGVITQMSELQKTMGELKGISSQVGSLEKTLNGVKTKGIAGEVQLKQIIADVLTPQQYEIEARIKPGSNDHVEIAIKLPQRSGDGYVYLPIDSKCHLDCYEALIDAYNSGDGALIASARKTFSDAIKKDAKTIADKYISVPNTTPYAILFVPFEGMYSEIVNLNLLEEMNALNITIAGPYTLTAILSTVTNYFQALAIEKKSREIETTLGLVKSEFKKYQDALDQVGKNLETASKNLETLRVRRTNAMNRALRSVVELDGGLLPESVGEE